jgi:hypothetical protein
LLRQTLEEEKKADALLTQLAKTGREPSLVFGVRLCQPRPALSYNGFTAGDCYVRTRNVAGFGRGEKNIDGRELCGLARTSKWRLLAERLDMLLRHR